MPKKKAKKKKKAKSRSVDWSKGTKTAQTSLKLDPGTNYVMLVEEYFARNYEHWIKIDKNESRPIMCFAEMERNNKISLCPVCAKEASLPVKSNKIITKNRYFFNAVKGTLKKGRNGKYVLFDYDDAMLFPCGPKIGVPICTVGEEINVDEDGEWGNVESITGVAFKITRTGEKLNTSYDVRVFSGKIKVKGELPDLPDLDSIASPDDDKKEAKKILRAAFGSKNVEDDDEYEDDSFDDDEYEDDSFDDDEYEDDDEFDDEYEDDDEFDDEFDDDEFEEPKKVKKKKKAKKKKRR